MKRFGGRIVESLEFWYAYNFQYSIYVHIFNTKNRTYEKETTIIIMINSYVQIRSLFEYENSSSA